MYRKRCSNSACGSLNEVAWWRVLSLPSLQSVANTPSRNWARRWQFFLQLLINGQVSTLPLYGDAAQKSFDAKKVIHKSNAIPDLRAQVPEDCKPDENTYDPHGRKTGYCPRSR